MKNFISEGDTLTFTASGNVASGEGVLVGSAFGVATGPVANAEPGTLKLTGVFDLPKIGSQAWSVGNPIYWDASSKACTNVGSTHKQIGIAVLATGSTSGEKIGRVRLNGSPAPIAAHVADASAGSGAEINALRDALIAAGLMASP